MSRKGNCLFILLILALALIGGFYLLLRTPEKEKASIAKKPVIKSFPKDISGNWKARFVRVNPPPGRRGEYKASWMQNNPRDFEASVEIGSDFHLKSVKWFELYKSYGDIKIEWYAPDRWKYFMRDNKGRSNEERGESFRDGSRLKVSYIGFSGKVRECRFDFEGKMEIPERYNLDGGFRETENQGEIEAEIMLFAPEITGKTIRDNTLYLKLNPYGLEFDMYRFKGIDERLKTQLNLVMGNTRVGFSRLKEMRLDIVKGIDLKDLQIKGYPGPLSIGLRNVNAKLWFGPKNKQDGDRVHVEQLQDLSEAILEKAHSAHKRAKVVFAPDGTGKLFTHDGKMEYQLLRE